MAFTLPGGLVTFQRMKESSSPVQVKTGKDTGKDVKIKAFPGVRPSYTQVAMSTSKRGHFATGLSPEEQAFLEPYLGLDKGGLTSIIPNLSDPEKVRTCYWLQPFAMIELPVTGPRTLDLSVAKDYVEYKALTQMNKVAVGMSSYYASPDAEYVLINQEDVVKEKGRELSIKKKAYLFTADWTATQYSDYLWSQGLDPRHLSPDALETQVGEQIEKNPDFFLKQVQDSSYKDKVQIGELVRYGVLEVRGKSYKFKGQPLADSLEEMVDFMQDKQKQGTKIEILRELKERK